METTAAQVETTKEIYLIRTPKAVPPFFATGLLLRYQPDKHCLPGFQQATALRKRFVCEAISLFSHDSFPNIRAIEETVEVHL